jgi:hypothetical protein
VAPSLQRVVESRKERNVKVRQNRAGTGELYVRVDGSSVIQRHVAVVRCTVGSRRGCSNAKRHHRQSGGELLDLHGASDCGCGLCVRND